MYNDFLKLIIQLWDKLHVKSISYKWTKAIAGMVSEEKADPSTMVFELFFIKPRNSMWNPSR